MNFERYYNEDGAPGTPGDPFDLEPRRDDVIGRTPEGADILRGVVAGTPEAALLATCEDAGRAAGTWYEIPNEDAAAAVLRGIADGDPAVLDTFPAPRWGGEWADEPTWSDLLAEHELDADAADDLYADAVSAFCDAAAAEIERAALVLAPVDFADVDAGAREAFRAIQARRAGS